MRRAALAVGIAVGLASIGACVDLVSPPYAPAGMTEITPPAEYAAWWRAIDSCSGRPRPMSVQFFVVPDLGVENGGVVGGRYDPATDRIFLLPGFVYDSVLVDRGVQPQAARDQIRRTVTQHEMLHAHLRFSDYWRDRGQLRYEYGHPAEFFGVDSTHTEGKCTGLLWHGEYTG